MSKLTINIGTAANAKNGDSLRAAFNKVNANFTELYTALGLDSGGLNLGAFEFSGSTISTTDSTAITIDQAVTVTSDLSVGGDILPQAASGSNLGSSSYPWRSLYVSNNTIFIGGTAVGIDDAGNLTVAGAAVNAVGSAAWSAITGKPTFATVATSGSYTDLSSRPTIPTAVSQLTNDAGYITAASIPTDFKGSVFADDSTLLVDAVSGSIPYSVLSGAPTIPTDISQLTDTGNLIGSSNPFDQDLNINNSPNFVNVSLTGTAGAGYATVSIATNRDFVIGLIDQFTGAKTFEFGRDGSLTVPGDIRSQGEINIDINLADSTLRRWTFGEDGILNIPGGIKTSGFTIDLSTYRGVDDAGLGDYTITIDGNNIRSDKDSIGLQTVNGYGIFIDESSKNVLLGDLSSGVEINLLFGSESITGEDWDAQLKMPNVGGPGVPSSFSITTQGDTNVWTFGGDGSLQIPGDIRSEGNINIDINLSDSTLRRWTFGEDGELTLAGPITNLRTNELKISLGNNSSADLYGVAVGHLTQAASYDVAVGAFTGQKHLTNDTRYTVAVGAFAQQNENPGDITGDGAVAIGVLAGDSNQGANAVALGRYAGRNNQAARSIVINATGSDLENTTADSFVVKPVREVTGGVAPAGFYPAYYNPTTGEFIVVSP